MVFTRRLRMKDLLLRARRVLKTSKVKISRRRLADYVKKLHQKACQTHTTIIFLHSTNQIIDLWRCHCRWHRDFLNSKVRLWDSWHIMYTSQSVSLTQSIGRTLIKQCRAAWISLRHCNGYLWIRENLQVTGGLRTREKATTIWTRSVQVPVEQFKLECHKHCCVS